MQTPLVSAELLQKSDKILFITHLALGDFTYLQNYFQAFAEMYPHIKIHIWVDEVRRTHCFWRWEHLKKYALYDWLADCSFVEKIYNQTYSPGSLKKSIQDARQEKYPLIVSLATLRPHFYVRLAHKINAHATLVGLRHHISFFDIKKYLSYRKLRVSILVGSTAKEGKHISDIYADWFHILFGIDVDQPKRFPFVQIPHKWMLYAKLKFLKWKIDKKSNKFGKVFFINPFAKSPKRCWPLEHVAQLIQTIKRQDIWGDVSFIVNVVPEEIARARSYFDNQSLSNTYLFSADHNFFQLPAILSQCDLIISVETAVMHLANAVHVPVIALMRQKNPEWVPIDSKNSVIITTTHRNDWVNAITIDQVMDALEEKE